MKILHTGDTHIGYRQYGSDARRRDFLEAFEHVVRDAIEEDVDVLVHAGDLFHSRNPRLEDVIPTIELFRDLRDAGVTVLAVVGNHERKRHDQWLDLLENMDAVTRLGREPVVIDAVAFYGVDYVPPSRIDGFAYDDFVASEEASTNLLVMHGRFEPFPYGEWPLERFVEESDVDWDRFLLGDYHHHERETVAGVPAAYCGSTERASTEERESRGYDLLTVEDGEISVARRSIPTRDFVFVDVEVTEDADDATADVVARTDEYEVEDAVVIVDVDGAPEPTVVQSDVETAVADRGATVVRVNDRRDDRDRDESEIEVSFVDPDDAVRERLDAMRLSEAGRLVDDVVRGDRVPDANLKDAIESEVSDLVDGGGEAGDDVFERPDEAQTDAETEVETETETGAGAVAEAEAEAETQAETAADAGADGDRTVRDDDGDGSVETESEGHDDGATGEPSGDAQVGATEADAAADGEGDRPGTGDDASGSGDDGGDDGEDASEVASDDAEAGDGETVDDGGEGDGEEGREEVAGQSGLGDWA